MTQQEITDKVLQASEEAESRRIAEEEPKFGHVSTRMDPDERPRSEAERKPGTTPGENADSHAEAHAASKGVNP